MDLSPSEAVETHKQQNRTIKKAKKLRVLTEGDSGLKIQESPVTITQSEILNQLVRAKWSCQE